MAVASEAPTTEVLTAQVVTIGEAMLRLSGAEGTLLDAVDTLDVDVAGSELNVAIALSNLGVTTRWISALPNSPLGRRVARDVRAAGVDSDAIRWIDDSRLGVFFVERGVEPRPTRVWFDRADSAFTRFGRLASDDVRGAAFGVLSGITPALGPDSRTLADDFVSHCHATDTRLCFDVNYRERLWSTEHARAALAPYLHAADIVVCSERDARRVLGATGDEAQVLDQLCQEWATSADTVVLTRGTAGALAVGGDGVVITQAATPTHEVDGFGAGDAFFAGLIWGLLRRRALAETLRAATTLASLKCTVRGDQSPFSSEDLELAMSGQSEIVR